jgi:hypothetical protein
MESELFANLITSSKCNNCGGDSHCKTRSTRKEQQYEVDGGKEYEIEVCRECRCDACK